jgi:hypothetical protein
MLPPPQLLVLVLVLLQTAAHAASPPQPPRLWTDPIPPLEVLGLAPPPFYQFWPFDTPSDATVKSAFRQKSLLFHPDKNHKNPDAAHSFYRVSQAHEHLRGNDALGKATRELEARYTLMKLLQTTIDNL